MRESIGSVFLYNMVILFIIIVFGLISATISYYKAFKVNERILGIIEKFEGYNSLAKTDIEDYLTSIGYTSLEINVQSSECPEFPTATDKGTLMADKNSSHLYCVYFIGDDRGEKETSRNNGDSQPIYYNYSVISYIFVNLPIVGEFKLPVYTKGERTYNFSDGDTDTYSGYYYRKGTPLRR